MGKIILMDASLSNKIAAGEVVERPASVVKELVENAIDANSTVIEIEAEEGGLSKIRVVDNGDGMEPDDCEKAFKRHATSKIKDEADLFRIRTLGFRGEALPSIAAVSHLEMKTSTGDKPGTKITLIGGKVTAKETASSRKGTDITVTNLFFNTPARLKYMKSLNTELGRITDIVNRLALSYPNISFKFTHNGRRLLYTNGKGDVRQVLAAIYGVPIAKKMFPIHFRSLDFDIRGYLSLPEVTRASKNYISTMINGRFIKNHSITKAVEEGYHTLLPIGRFPVVYLHIEMDPILVDVNVHPAKLEVRISKEAELFEVIAKGIQDAFKKKELIPTSDTVKKKKEHPVNVQQEIQFEHLINKEKQDPEWTFQPKTADNQWYEDDLYSIDHRGADEEQQQSFSSEKIAEPPVVDGETEVQEHLPNNNEEHEEKVSDNNRLDESRVPPMYPIGQMHGTYILAQNEKGLYIIDQHAAQERIKYEYFREKVGEVASEVQEMLVPLTLSFSSDEVMVIEEHKEELAEVGVFLENFGPNTYIIRSHPTWFPQGEEKEIIEELIQQVLNEKKTDIHKLREDAAIMMSCKGSIKANQYLNNEEIFALLESLRKASDPFTCPHGRPIIIHFSTYELEKMFKRVM
ncbi:DNA mismatch repair endonuclease MutL [Aeribacillus composti]|uniref:DNA mismatch repair endonuclease MutL n=1 Tax=Aeribacillus composti TaxID=1868734 RepID=UPI003D2196E4